MVNELTPEQEKIQEIQALTAMNGWRYLVEDFKSLIEEYETAIFDIELSDLPTHSKKSIYIALRNCLVTFIEKPESVISELTSITTK